jgi:voltage-gated potassium channel
VVARWFDWAIWLVFFFETSLLVSLVRDKKRYLLTNWMNLTIIVAGIPTEWTYTPLIGALRNLRLLLMMFLLMRLSRRIRSYLARGHLGSMLLITGVITILAGIIITRLDPTIGTIWDGMWYSWVTISHTGYGDIVPKTAAARFFGGILILLGIVLVTVFTANLSAFLIGSGTEQNPDTKKTSEASEITLQDLMKRLEHIEKMLEDQKK